MAFRYLLFIIGSYLLGGILFARLFGRLIAHKDITAEADDRNPGTINAFKNGGAVCGILTLCMDLLKGFLPVFLFMKYSGTESSFWIGLVIAAPVLGHIFPVFHKFKGGKGIAATFGCLLGLIPKWRPVLCLAAAFLFFSFVLCVTPDYYKTLLSYLTAEGLIFIFSDVPGVLFGFTIINIAVALRMLTSKEDVGEFKMRLLWKY